MNKFIFAFIIFENILCYKSLRCYSCINCLGDLRKASVVNCSEQASWCFTEYTVRNNGDKTDLKRCTRKEKICKDEKNTNKRRKFLLKYYTCNVCTSDKCNSESLMSVSMILVMSFVYCYFLQ